MFCHLEFQTQVNLVPNPSFEELDSCDWEIGELFNMLHWFNPNDGTSDAFNSCCFNSDLTVPINVVGYQHPRTGDGYCGISIYIENNPFDYREYIEVKLNEPLIENAKYYVEFFVSLADSLYAGDFASNCLGAYLSVDELLIGEPLIFNVEPQVNSETIIESKVNWTKISGNFTAIGGEEYLTIGCFSNDGNIDILPVIDSSEIEPFQSYYFIDDVSVYLSEIDYIIEIPNVITPNGDNINDSFEVNYKGYIGIESLIIYNRWGVIMYNSKLNETSWNGEISGRKVSEGVYYYRILARKRHSEHDEFKGYVQLFR